MSAIKKFFQQRKLDAKFKLAGEGHKLTDDTRRAAVSPSQSDSVLTEQQLSEEKTMAAGAALARMNQAKTGPPSLKAKAKQEMTAEKKALEKKRSEAASAASASPVSVELEVHPAASKVLFRCPLAGPELLPKEQMESHIEQFLLSQLADEPTMASSLMIQTLNKNSEQVKLCIDTLGKYLDNVIEHPGEEKYQRIRCSNKVLTEKVLACRGALEFLHAAGFEKMSVEDADGKSDEYLVLSKEKAEDVECLKSLKEILRDAEPIRPELDRDVRVYYPSSKASKIEVPDEFYTISVEELKREMQIRQEAVEKFGMLRTKEMRERDRIRELRRYRYCLVRIRFPDGTLLQGTFRATEKLPALLKFVAENLEHDWIPFTLSNHLSSKLVDEDLSLAELDLTPASLVQFAYDPKIVAEIATEKKGFQVQHFLKKELLSKISSL